MDTEISVMQSPQREYQQPEEAGRDKGGTGSSIGGLQAYSDARPGFSVTVRQHTSTALSSEAYGNLSSAGMGKIKTNILNWLDK